jgi:predicted nucleotidyltransferase
MIMQPNARQMEGYRQTLRRREEEERRALTARRQRAWELARQASGLLKSRYGASRVVVFGSLTNDARFHLWSDVDLAAWGIPPDQSFRAIGDLLDLAVEIELNLVDTTTCRPSLLERIEREGLEL